MCLPYLETAGLDSRRESQEIEDSVWTEKLSWVFVLKFHDEEIFLHSEDSIVKAYVVLVEQMGAETYLYLKVDGIDLIARVAPRSTAKAGETITVALDPNRLYFFDKETEESLLVR